MSHSEIIAMIQVKHRERCFAMEQRKRLDLALGSFLRLMMGWRKDLPEDERKAIATEVARMMDESDGPWSHVIIASRLGTAPFEECENDAKKEMARLAKQLPVWESFGANVRGFGEVSLAVIVAEAGDLSNYSSIAKLWKRMGLAVMDGQRQGNPGKGADAADWIAHGYSPVRRSRMWNIGDTLIKGNRTGPYRTSYLDRKAYEIARNPEMTPMQAHRRAQRYMEKRLLKHLWQAWRRTIVIMAEKPKPPLSDANLSRRAA